MEGRFSEASVAQQDLIVNNLGILTLPQLVWSSKLNEALLLAEWVVLDLSSAGRLLLIGDLPILREGQLDGAFILVIPLSPTRLFLAFSSEDYFSRIVSHPIGEIVDFINTCTAEQAHAKVFGATAELLDLVSVSRGLNRGHG